MLKDLGRYGRQGMVDSLYPFAIALLKQDGWTVEKIVELCDQVRDSLVKKQAGDVGKYYFQGWVHIDHDYSLVFPLIL